jgi:mannose-6-phosphate isomerase-like protein (cupin superfamily)
MDVRLVVTGHDPHGKAVVASDTAVPPITLAAMPGAEFHRLWGADSAQTYPDAGAPPSAPAYFPPVGGFRFGLFTIPPVGVSDYPDDMEAAMADVEAKLPGLMSHMEIDDPGMHTTDTTDFEIVLSGTVILELDDGVEVTLSPGDTVVQNGTRHRWRNPGTEPAVLGVAIVGAHRS